jgi:phospholipase/carboxylesterase
LSTRELETVEVETGKRPRLAVIWLHGLGADGHDFEPIVPELALPFAARFVFPHAPIRRVTINNGALMRAWFDIVSLSRSGPEDEGAIRASAALVARLIDVETARGLESHRVVLAGFSQGGAIALHQGLRELRALGGIIALSTFLPLASTLAQEKAAVNAHVPIFMAHGTADPVVDPHYAEQSLLQLRREGYRPNWTTYPMGHGVCAEEVDDISAWLSGIEHSRAD